MATKPHKLRLSIWFLNENGRMCCMFQGLKLMKVGIETDEVRDVEEALTPQRALAKEEKP